MTFTSSPLSDFYHLSSVGFLPALFCLIFTDSLLCGFQLSSVWFLPGLVYPIFTSSTLSDFYQLSSVCLLSALFCLIFTSFLLSDFYQLSADIFFKLSLPQVLLNSAPPAIFGKVYCTVNSIIIRVWTKYVFSNFVINEMLQIILFSSATFRQIFPTFFSEIKAKIETHNFATFLRNSVHGESWTISPPPPILSKVMLFIVNANMNGWMRDLLIGGTFYTNITCRIWHFNNFYSCSICRY